MNFEKDHLSVETLLGSQFKNTSEAFDQKAQEMFASFERQSQGNVIQFPSKSFAYWISGAVAAAAVLAIVTVNFTSSFQQPKAEDLDFETIVAMDEVLIDGLGVLDEENIEALSSISWMVENS